jgi:hypothetical protein
MRPPVCALLHRGVSRNASWNFCQGEGAGEKRCDGGGQPCGTSEVFALADIVHPCVSSAVRVIGRACGLHVVSVGTEHQIARGALGDLTSYFTHLPGGI